MTTDPISAITNPIIGDAATPGGNSTGAPSSAVAQPADAAPATSSAPSLAESLAGQITANARDFPALNTQLIEMIRAELMQGRGHPDSQGIAQKLMEFEQLLLNSRTGG